MAFEKLIGNKKTKILLQNIMKNKKFLHSYMFVGNDGIGKMQFAKEFAKSILCLGEELCKSCIEFETDNHPDFNIIEPDRKQY